MKLQEIECLSVSLVSWTEMQLSSWTKKPADALQQQRAASSEHDKAGKTKETISGGLVLSPLPHPEPSTSPVSFQSNFYSSCVQVL